MVLGKIQAALGLSAIIAIIGLGGLSYYQYGVIQEKNEAIIAKNVHINVLSTENAKWQDSLHDMTDRYDTSQADIRDLEGSMGVLRMQRDGAIHELESYKSKLDVVLSKPKLIERMSNRATNKLFGDLACVTGDVVKCGGGK